MLPKVGLNPETIAFFARDMQCACVRGFGGNNAAPPMMELEVAEKTIGEIMRFPNIDRVPNHPEQTAENVNSRSLEILRSDRMKLELIGGSASSKPCDKGRI